MEPKKVKQLWIFYQEGGMDQVKPHHEPAKCGKKEPSGKPSCAGCAMDVLAELMTCGSWVCTHEALSLGEGNGYGHA